MAAHFLFITDVQHLQLVRIQVAQSFKLLFLGALASSHLYTPFWMVFFSWDTIAILELAKQHSSSDDNLGINDLGKKPPRHFSSFLLARSISLGGYYNQSRASGWLRPLSDSF